MDDMTPPAPHKVSVVFGSVGSATMAIGPLDDTLYARAQDIFAQTRAEPSFIGCAPAEHDLVLDHIRTQDTLLGGTVSIVYCRRCPYHYFPKKETE